MKSGDNFLNGTVWNNLKMPDGGIIFIYSTDKVDTFEEVVLYNHNVFRVDKGGNVMWQVTRIDSPSVNWEVKHRIAREEGHPGCIEPFIEFVLEAPDGTRYPERYPLDVIEWIPNWQVKLINLGLGTQWFTLDVDTGVANDITPKGRPW